MNDIKPKLLLGLLFGLGVIVGVALVADLNKVLVTVCTFRWGWLPLILSLTTFNYLLRFVKWHYYLGQVDIHNISRLDSLKVFLAGFSMTVTPGKSMDAVRQHRAPGHGPTRACKCRYASSLLLWYHV